MIEYYLPGYDITISIDSPQASTARRLEIIPGKRTTARQLEAVRRRLLTCSGIHGHLLRENVTPIDLKFAMESAWMERYGPQLVKGKEILDRYRYREGVPRQAVD